jgi:hypothetical protein
LLAWNHPQNHHATTNVTTTTAGTAPTSADQDDVESVLNVLIIDNLPVNAGGSSVGTSSKSNYAYVYSRHIGVDDDVPPTDDDVIYKVTVVTWRNGTVVFQLDQVWYDTEHLHSTQTISYSRVSTANTVASCAI